MTEILVSNETDASQAPPPAVDGAPPTDAAAPPAAPPAQTPEQIAAAAAVVAERKELSEIRQANERAFRAQRETKAAQARIAELETARAKDLEQLKVREDLAAALTDPDKALDLMEKHGLTAQQLVKRASQGMSPEDIIKQAEAKASAAAEAKWTALQAEKTKADQEQMDKTAAMTIEREFIAQYENSPAEYPTLHAMVGAGRVLKQAAVQETWNILQLAAQHTRDTGIRHTDDEVKKELELYLAKEYGSLTERRGAAAQKPGTASGSTETAKGSAAAPNVTDARANDLATLGADYPKDFEDWPPMKQNKWFIDQAAARKR